MKARIRIFSFVADVMLA